MRRAVMLASAQSTKVVSAEIDDQWLRATVDDHSEGAAGDGRRFRPVADAAADRTV